MKTSKDDQGNLLLTYTEDELRALKVNVLKAVVKAMRKHANSLSCCTSYEMCHKDGYNSACNHIAIAAESLAEKT